MSSLTEDQAVLYAIENAQDEHGQPLTIKQLADVMDVEEQWLYDLLSGPTRKALRLSEVVKLIRGTRQIAPLSVVARRLNYLVIALPSGVTGSNLPLKETAQLARKFGALLEELGLVTADDRITKVEARALRADGEELIQSVYALLELVDAMVGQTKGSAR